MSTHLQCRQLWRPFQRAHFEALIGEEETSIIGQGAHPKTGAASGGAIFDTEHGKIQRTFFKALALALTTLVGLPTPAEIGDPTDMDTRNTYLKWTP
jgi:hypothetical protein